MAERLTPPLPYPHLMAHPTRAMTLAYTPETAAINAAQGYRVVAVDTRQLALIFTPAMRVTIIHS